MQQENDRLVSEYGGRRGVPHDLLDVLRVQEVSKLTRAVIDAETRVASVKAMIMEHGYDVRAEEFSKQVQEDQSDVTTSSHERNAMALITPRIHKWVNALPHKLDGFLQHQTPSRRLNLDKWYVSGVGFGDYATVHVDPGRRAKIREWHETCT